MITEKSIAPQLARIHAEIGQLDAEFVPLTKPELIALYRKDVPFLIGIIKGLLNQNKELQLLEFQLYRRIDALTEENTRLRVQASAAVDIMNVFSNP